MVCEKFIPTLAELFILALPLKEPLFSLFSTLYFSSAPFANAAKHVVWGLALCAHLIHEST